jgi:hypothetical protein
MVVVTDVIMNGVRKCYILYLLYTAEDYFLQGKNIIFVWEHLQVICFPQLILEKPAHIFAALPMISMLLHF